MLLNNTIDMSAVTARVTSERMKYIDFSYPIWNYQYVLTFARPPDDNAYSFVFRPLSIEIWTVILILLFGSIINGSFYIFIEKYQTDANWTWYSIFTNILSLPGHNYDYTSNKHIQVLISVWAIASVILITFYTGRMSSELAVPLRPKPEITSRYQLVGTCVCGTCN
jgi:hypothetical protein